MRERSKTFDVGVTIAGACLLGGLLMETCRKRMPQASTHSKTIVTIINTDTSEVLVNRAVLRNEQNDGDFIFFAFRDGSVFDLDIKLGNYKIIRQILK